MATAAIGIAGAVAAPGAVGAAAASSGGSSGATITSRVIHGGQSTQLVAGATGGELAAAVGPEASTARAPVANRSLSSNARSTRAGLGLSGIPASNSSVQAAAAGTTTFKGIDHHQQRFLAGGNQWSLEPPDQALCVGGGYVFEAVNNAIAVYDAAGNQLAADTLNHFFNYAPEINRTTGVQGPQTTDPTCLFDPTTKRFFLTILTYFVDAAGNPTGVNTLDTAVSDSAKPTSTWTISHIDATDDGSNGTPTHPSCPCLGDYPHIGVDATGYYITTNEYPWATDGFNGAQIYAMSKAKLAAGAESLTVTQVDTSRGAPGLQPGFTVWPAQSPGRADYSTAANGTEYFLSTNAAPEANGTGSSHQLLTWSLTGTKSLDATPALLVHVVSSDVGTYALPPQADQKVGPTPLADCLNVTSCAKLVSGQPDLYKETERRLDALDSRMQQVTYANGNLYGSHGTVVDVGSSSSDIAQQAGVAWYVAAPTSAGNGNLDVTVTKQGRLAVAHNNLLMPTLGVRADGSAVMGVTLVGTNHYPSAAYLGLPAVSDAPGVVKVLAEGAGPEDGFAGYRIFGARPRWGDYGAAALDASGNLWVANEYIDQTCTYAQYATATPFGQCGGSRTALANWATRVSKVPAS
jgi:hypothetical protein